MSVSKKDIAEYVGVSRTTVSFVLNNTPNIKIAEKTRNKVLKAAKELGYWSNEVSPKICFILYERGESDPRYIDNIKIVARAAERYEHELMFMSVKANPKEHQKLQKFLKEQNAAGVIITGYLDDQLIDMVAETEVPCVFWGGTTREDVNVVTNDHKRAAYEATKYLISLNHTEIAFFSGSLQLSVHKLGLEGYREALEEAGIPLDKSLIQVSKDEDGYELCSMMDELDIKYSAAYCVNTVIQSRALQWLKEKGVSVPGEVSLIGYELTNLVKVSIPELTVVYVDPEEKLKIASRLIDIIRKVDEAPRVITMSKMLLHQGGSVSLQMR